MKTTTRTLFIILTFSYFVSFAQNHKGKCGLEINKAYTQTVLGKNIGYYVEFQNNGTSEIDAIEWTANFYNNFNEFKGKREGKWSSGNIIKPIKVGDTTKDLESNWVPEATKVFITVKRVHFTNNKPCK
jgi:hypothetical protein